MAVVRSSVHGFVTRMNLVVIISEEKHKVGRVAISLFYKKMHETFGGTRNCVVLVT